MIFGFGQLKVVVPPLTLDAHTCSSVVPSKISATRFDPLTPFGVGIDTVIAALNVTFAWVEPVNVISQNASELALSGRRFLLCAAGGESELAALKTTLTPLGSVVDDGNVTEAPVTPEDAGKVTVAPAVAEIACVTVDGDGDGDGDGEIAGDGEGPTVGGRLDTEEPPQPASAVETMTKRPSPKTVLCRNAIHAS